MHLLKNSWQFSFKISEKAARISLEKPQFTSETHNVCQGYTILVYSAFLWPVFKIAILSSLHYTKLRATICLVQTLLCDFVRQFSPTTAFSVSNVHQLIDMVATHDFLSNGYNHLNAHYCV